MKKFNALIAAAVLLPFGAVLFAQYGTPGQETSEQQQMSEQQSTSSQSTQPTDTDWQWKMGKKATLTGCLTQSTVGALTGTVKEAAAEDYMLKRQGMEQEITVKGLADLAEHKDHMVQLSGTMDQEDGKQFFKVSQIKHVGNTCEAKTGLGKATGKSTTETTTEKSTQAPEQKY